VRIGISIIICTYNRAEILDEVLNNLLSKTKEIKECDILIIDNNSKDNTGEVVKKYMTEYTNIYYFVEYNQGLSHARNRGIAESTKDYLLFLDDDALADELLIKGYTSRLLQYQGVKVLGGIYVPWYKYGKPKWYKDKYASKIFNNSGFHEIDPKDSLSGGNMLFHRNVFLECGLFDVNLGMNKDVIAYGEENELQERIKSKGIKIYGDNSLIIYHVVQPYKLNRKWFFNQKKASGKTLFQMKRDKIHLLVGLAILVGQLLTYPVFNFFKLIKRDYYWDNYMIDTFSKPLKWLTFLSLKINPNHSVEVLKN
jgi:GT2 family glycosyltransferase